MVPASRKPLGAQNMSRPIGRGGNGHREAMSLEGRLEGGD